MWLSNYYFYNIRYLYHYWLLAKCNQNEGFVNLEN